MHDTDFLVDTVRLRRDGRAAELAASRRTWIAFRDRVAELLRSFGIESDDRSPVRVESSWVRVGSYVFRPYDYAGTSPDCEFVEGYDTLGGAVTAATADNALKDVCSALGGYLADRNFDTRTPITC